MKERHERVPDGWEVVKVGDLARYINGLPFKPSDWEKDGRPIIRIQNLTGSNKSFNYTAKIVGDDFVVRPGDILVSWSATLDAFIWSGPEAVLNQHIFKVEPFELCVDPAFLFWGLKEVIQEMWQGEHTHGSTMKHINRGPFLAHKFPLPPLPEQRRIAAKLEELMGRVDACRKRLEQVPRLIKQFRQSVLAAACSGRLTGDWRNQNQSIAFQSYLTGGSEKSDLSDSWKVASVQEVASIGSGQSSAEIISRCKSEGEVPWFKVSDMNSRSNEKFMRVSQNYLSMKEVKELRLKVFPSGSIIFPKRGGAIATNKKRLLVKPSCVDLNVMVLTPNKEMQDYFWIWFSSVDLASLSDGSNVPQINNTDILPLELPLPSLAEQQEIIGRVESLFKIADAVEDHYRKAQEQLDKLPQAILAKAFRGELVPQDPKDEPASTLLKRILAEKSGGEKVVRKVKQSQRKIRQKGTASLPFAKLADSQEVS